MGKQSTTAEFMLTAQNRTQAAFSQLSHGFTDAQNRAKKFNAQVASMGSLLKGGLIGGAMTGMVRSVISAGDEIGDLAERTNVGVESIQSLKIVAGDAGIRLDRLVGVFNNLQGKMEEARVEGGEKLLAAFNKLGVSAEMLASGNVEKVFEQIAKALSQGAGDATTSAAAHDLLGSSVEKLAPVFKAAAGGMANLNEEMKANGEILSKQQVAQLSRADRTIERFGNKAKVMVAGGIENTGALLAGARAGGSYKEMQAAQGEYFSSLNGPRAQLKARPFADAPGPSNFVSQSSENSAFPDFDPMVQQQGKMISVLDRIDQGIAKMNRGIQSSQGPIGP